MYKHNVTLFDCLVPTPVTNLSVNDVSTTTITVNWTSPSSEDGNYVTYYNISYSPSCPELSSVNVTLVSVTPHQFTTTLSYILRELFSGMNYTITVRAGNIVGESSPMMINKATLMTGNLEFFLFLMFVFIFSAPNGLPTSLSIESVNISFYNISWNQIDCYQRNGHITSYVVLISRDDIEFNISSTTVYILTSDLVLGKVYNISVAGVNDIGMGPFSEPVSFEIGNG